MFSFLQQILPQLHLRWSGFQRVRRQVCRRLRNRFLKLGLEDCTSYTTYLLAHPVLIYAIARDYKK